MKFTEKLSYILHTLIPCPSCRCYDRLMEAAAVEIDLHKAFQKTNHTTPERKRQLQIMDARVALLGRIMEHVRTGKATAPGGAPWAATERNLR